MSPSINSNTVKPRGLGSTLAVLATWTLAFGLFLAIIGVFGMTVAIISTVGAAVTGVAILLRRERAEASA